MTSRAAPALLQALALVRAPRGPRPRLEERLPEGMELLIRIAAGDEQAIALAQATTAEKPESLREAAGFYIQQVMFAANSHSYRVLGVDSDASEERLKSHYRWLTRWLHPDRNRDDWEAVYAERVNSAWQDLRNGERRRRYDQGRAASVGAGTGAMQTEKPINPAPPGVFVTTETPDWNLRWLPQAVFGALGLSAILTVAFFYALQWAESSQRASTLAANAPPTERPGPGPVDPAELRMLPLAEATPSEAPQPPQPEPVPAPIVVEPAPALTPVEAPAPVATTAAGIPRPTTSPPVSTTPRSIAPVPIPTEIRTLPSEQSRAGAETPRPVLAAVVVAKPPPRPSPAPARIDGPATQSGLQAAMDGHDANRVLDRFSAAYSQGDLVGMRAMFTDDARSPRGGLNAILTDYDRLFESSSERSLAVRNVSWFGTGATVTIIASYQATVVSGRFRRPRRFHGDLRLDLRREDDQWRIYRLQHDEQPG